MLLPHIAWQVANDWPTLEFIHNNAVGREGIDAAVVMTSPMAFAVSQIFVMGPLMFPLWLLGLGYLMCARDSREYRVLGWTFASVFMFVALSSRGSIYYLVGAFPIVLAAGGVAIEKFARERVQYLPALACTVAVIQGLLVVPFVVPIVDPDRYLALARNARQMIGAERDRAFLPPVYQWMLGAKELIDAVARVTYTLSESDRYNAGVLATTFGEAGALVHFGPAASLPPIIATHNSFWLWGTGALDGSVLIVVADADSPVLQQFSSCELADRVDCPQCEPRFGNREVFVCRDPVRPLSQVWAKLKDFS
jgi:hypothetical protein